MSTIKKTLADHKNAVIIAATVALVALACAFAVYLRLYTGKELWYEMFAAIIGVVITAIITMMLLVGQTDSDEKREKKGKVFEEKLRMYQEYLDTLYEVLKDGRITNDEKLRLAFKTSSVAMHCAPERVKKISNSVKKIFNTTINENGNALETLNEKNWKELLKELFNVMDEFKADLYQDFKGNDIPDWEETLDNFTNAFSQGNDESNIPQFMPDDGNDGTETAGAEAVSEEWEDMKATWAGKGWAVDDYLSNGNGFMLKLTGSDAGNNKPAYINVGWDNGHYYIQASYQRDPNFSKALKWEYGGRRSYGTWWKYFDGKYYNIPDGKLCDFIHNDEGLRKYLKAEVERLMDIVEREHNTMQWLDKVGPRDGWTTFTWCWDTLACDYNNEELGRPFFDTTRDAKTGKVTIVFYNRADQPQLAEQLVHGIEDCGSLTPNEEGRYLLETLDGNACDVPSKVKEWMDKIEKGAKK